MGLAEDHREEDGNGILTEGSHGGGGKTVGSCSKGKWVEDRAAANGRKGEGGAEGGMSQW